VQWVTNPSISLKIYQAMFIASQLVFTFPFCHQTLPRALPMSKVKGKKEMLEAMFPPDCRISTTFAAFPPHFCGVWSRALARGFLWSVHLVIYPHNL